MTEQEQALARRAVACEGWRWLPGMAAVDRHGVRGRILIIEDLQYNVANRAGASWLTEKQIGRCLPDLTDPATLGCLLALVRAAWATPAIWAEPTHDGACEVWVYAGGECLLHGFYQTEAEALVAALEAAP